MSPPDRSTGDAAPVTAAYRIDGCDVDADAFYAAACNPQRSVVVEACAGAGKTWMLVSRILRALLDGVEPEQILAITFTRKAAGEMQARLDEWLHAFSNAASSPAERVAALRQRGLTAASAERLAPALGELRQRLLRRPRGVEVRTFHAWFAQLAGQLPLQLRLRLGLPAEPTLLEDVSPLHDELFRRFQRRVHADDALRDDHDQLVLQHRRSAVQDWLDTAWRRGDELELADRHGVLDTSMPDAAALDPRCAGLDHPVQLLAAAAPQQAWQALARELLALKGAKPRSAGAALDLALEAARRADLAAAFDQAWAALFTTTGAPRKGLGDSVAQQAVVDELLALRRLGEQQRAHDDHLRMVRLSRVLRAEYGALKRSRSLVDMSDLERAAWSMLSDPVTAGWVQQRLDLRIQQVLIDEFQDTSPLQWHALFGWLSAYAGAGGGASGQRPPGVFIVGDPKQSIYRFRRAEPRVFDAARDFVVHGLDGQVLACDHTRRNAPAVVAALNAVFGDAAAVDGWGPFRAHTTGSTADGELLALPGVPRPVATAVVSDAARWRDSLTEPRHEPEEHLKFIEARRVAAHIADAVVHDGLDPGRVMVLARQRAMLHRVAQSLAALGLPCVMPESLSLADEPEVQDLIALLDALASRGHDLSLARALKSPLFACSDDDLLLLSQRARRLRQPWFDVLAALPVDEGSAALARARRLLAGWARCVDELTPHELLDRIVHEGDLTARVLAATAPPRRAVVLQLLHGLLQAALELDGGRFVSTYRFVRALKQGRLKAAPQVPAGAVQLLTVHGAKGLEADVVHLVDVWPERRNPERSALLVDWPVDAPAPRRAAFISSEARMPPALDELLLRERREREREEINGLYVAMTRARQRLVVSHTEPHQKPSSRSWWQRLQPVLQPAQQAGTQAVEQSLEQTVEPAALESPSAGWPPASVPVLPTAPEPQPLDQPDPVAEATMDTLAAALGRAVHRLLEWIGQPAQPLARERRAAAAAQAACAFGLPPGAAAEVAALAATIADSPACAAFFGGPALRWAGNEVPMTGAQGQALRIDRLVQLDDGGGAVWWVLDYKLHHRPDALSDHVDQIQVYRLAVQAALQLQGVGAVRVRAAFITGAGEVVEA